MFGPGIRSFGQVRMMRVIVVVTATVATMAAGVRGAHAQGTQAASAESSSAQAPASQPAPETLAEALRRVKITAGTDLVATSAYIWRGFVPTDAFSLQPTSWIRVGGLTISSWANVAGRRAGGPLTEHDVIVDYSASVGRLTLSAGWINYVFPPAETGRHSDEVYAGVAHASYLNPAVRVYQDVHAGSGTYLNAGVAHEYPMGHGIAVTPSASIGYNHHQWIDRSTFSDATVGVKVKMPTGLKHLSVAPFVNYSRTLARELFPSRIYGGLGISVQ